MIVVKENCEENGKSRDKPFIASQVLDKGLGMPFVEPGRRLGLAGLGLLHKINFANTKQMFDSLVQTGETVLAKDNVLNEVLGFGLQAESKKNQKLRSNNSDSLKNAQHLINDERLGASNKLKMRFQRTVEQVKSKQARLPRHIGLELYALYKQANHGNVTGKRPAMSYFVQRAKYDAWLAKENMKTEDAMKAYIGLAEQWVLNPTH